MGFGEREKMKKLIHSLSLIALLGLTACAPQKDPAPAPAKAPATAHPAAPEVKADALADSAWMWAYFTVWFRHGGKMLVRGPELSQLSSDGVEGTYTLEGTAFEANVMDEVRGGTFENGKLVIEGQEALRLPATENHNGSLAGIVALVDPPGNIITSIAVAELEAAGIARGSLLKVEVKGQQFTARYVASYGEVPQGARLAKPSVYGLVELATNWGDGEKVKISEQLQAGVGDSVSITPCPGCAEPQP